MNLYLPGSACLYICYILLDRYFLTNFVRPSNPTISDGEEQNFLEAQFRQWFYRYVRKNSFIYSYINIYIYIDLYRSDMSMYNTWYFTYICKQADSAGNIISNDNITTLARGPARAVKTYPGYFVNGYRFHTKTHATTRATDSSGVCVLGKTFGNDEEDYYGVLGEIIELNYISPTVKRPIVFNCSWFDTRSRGGTRMHPQLKLVDVNRHRMLRTKDRYILAHQATQVYFLEYPKVRRTDGDWIAVCKVKSRVWPAEGVDPNESSSRRVAVQEAFQQDSSLPRVIDDLNDADRLGPLNDPDNTLYVNVDADAETSSETSEEEFDSEEDTDEEEL
jgi:hypothetical protein